MKMDERGCKINYMSVKQVEKIKAEEEEEERGSVG